MTKPEHVATLEAVTAKPDRITIIDALRGFALAGIVIVHIVEQYAGAPLPSEAMESTRLGWPDHAVDWFIQFFLRGKFFALFSILFGLSFFIQFDNASNRGTSYTGRYLWRIFLLFVIGYIHHGIYRGDILTIYALLAPFLLLFLRSNNAWVWGTILFILLGVPRALTFLFGADLPLIGNQDMDPEGERVAAYWQLLQTGSFADVFMSNAIDGFKMKMEFQLGIFYRFYLTFAFFLGGMWLGRIGYFKNLDSFHKTNKRVLLASIAGFFIFGVLTAVAFMQMGGEFSFENPWAIVGIHMADMVNVCMTILILVGFVLFYQTSRGQKLLDIFTEYGRTALTNYVFQSIIGTSILFGWGLGMIGEWRNIYLFVLAIVIIGLQIVLSKWWLQKFKYGPLEWLWRSAAYFKRM